MASGSSNDVNCTDFGAILSRLEKLRRADDLIVVSLNNELPTRSFDDSRKSKQICEKFRAQLVAISDERNKLIQRCIQEVTEKSVQEEHNSRLWRNLLRQIKGESDVEKIIEDRSRTAVHERCDRL